MNLSCSAEKNAGESNEEMQMLEPAGWVKLPGFGEGKQLTQDPSTWRKFDPSHQHGRQESLESFQMLPLEVQLPKKFFGFFYFLDRALLRAKACSFQIVHRSATSFSLVPRKSSLIQNGFTRYTSINPSSWGPQAMPEARVVDDHELCVLLRKGPAADTRTAYASTKEINNVCVCVRVRHAMAMATLFWNAREKNPVTPLCKY